MSQFLTCESRTIGGKEYQIRVLSVGEGARKIYHRLLSIVGDKENLAGLDPVFTAIMAGALSEEDTDALVKTFAPTTTVDMGGDPQRTVSLKDPKVQDEIFSANLEEMFEWLSACVEVNFGGVIAKMRGALSSFGDKAQTSQPKDK
jgi:hypothetical protein